MEIDSININSKDIQDYFGYLRYIFNKYSAIYFSDHIIVDLDDTTDINKLIKEVESNYIGMKIISNNEIKIYGLNEFLMKRKIELLNDL